MSTKSRTTFHILIVVTFLMVASVVLYTRKDFKLPEFSFRPSGRADNQVGCLLETRVGDRHLRMNLVMGVENREQRDDLLNKIPAIKNELLMSADRPDFIPYLEIRDFDAIRDHVLRTVNRHTRKPVNRLFFESYFFD